MRKIWAIGGIPGTGKTTLVRAVMANLAVDWEPVRPYELVDAIYSKSLDTYVLGKYDQWYEVNGYAQGTDKLSMAVQPKAVEFLKETSSSIIFEGDRLFTSTFLELCVALPETNTQIVILKSNDLQQRYAQRGSEQSEKFISGRKTKYENISSNFLLWENITERSHNTPDDTSAIVKLIEESYAI
jgi:nicotinamide riboside kinase